MGEAAKLKRGSPEWVDAISAATKAAMADPSVRAKISMATKAALADPTVRAKMSARAKIREAAKAIERQKYVLAYTLKISDGMTGRDLAAMLRHLANVVEREGDDWHGEIEDTSTGATALWTNRSLGMYASRIGGGT